MFYTVYKIVNKVNKKIYIGTHKTHNLDDAYMGSGVAIRRAIKKYGIENFVKTYINVFNNAEDMYALEAQIVNEKFVRRKNTYNVSVGGFNTIEYINSVGRNIYDGHQEQAKKNILKAQEKNKLLNEDPEYRKYRAKKTKEGLKKKYGKNFPKTFLGKKHKEESKEAIGKKNSIAQKGERNSQYGTCWVFSFRYKKTKKIKKEELETYLKKGWKQGRRMKF